MSRRKPLDGVRIAVTRARERARPLSRSLRARGARVIECAAIRTVAIARPPDLAKVMQGLCRYDWIVFTSARGVEGFFSLLGRRRKGMAALRRARLAVIGPGTGEELRRRGRKPDLVPPSYVAESLGRAMIEVRGRRVLIPRAEKARSVLPRSLRSRGAKVTVLPVYRTLPDRFGLAKLSRAVRAERLDAVVFTSPSTAEWTLRFLGRAGRKALRERIRAFSIGPVTSRWLASRGIRPAATAGTHTVEGLAGTIVRYYMKTRAGRARSAGTRAENR